MRISRRFAFVVPRFGSDIGGGAETLVRALAGRLALRGDSVEVFTTCAADNRSWENVHTPGKTLIENIQVTRFPVDKRDLDTWVPLQIRIAEGMNLSLDEQLNWMSQSVNSSSLYEEVQKRGDEFDAVFFAPYLFGTTFYGALVHSERSVLIPCLHDEYYAYLEVMGSLFRQVKGAVFNTESEKDLAQRLYGEVNGGEVGMGFEPYSIEYVNSLNPYFKENFPYVLYLGRKETGKNVPSLIDYFIAAKESGVLPKEYKLVIGGGGSFDDLGRPHAKVREDILDLPHLSEEEKRRLIKHALLLCQPSKNESFSIVLMEAWLLSTPVLVHSDCPVTREHVITSGGGFYFADAGDFGGLLGELVTNTPLRSELGSAGLSYVQDYYNWEAVLGRFDGVMGQLGL